MLSDSVFIKRKPATILEKAKKYLEELSPSSPGSKPRAIFTPPKSKLPVPNQRKVLQRKKTTRINNLSKYINDLSVSSEETRKKLEAVLGKQNNKVQLFQSAEKIKPEIPQSIFKNVAAPFPTSTPMHRAPPNVDTLTLSPIRFINKQKPLELNDIKEPSQPRLSSDNAVVVLERSESIEKLVEELHQNKSGQNGSNCRKELFSKDEEELEKSNSSSNYSVSYSPMVDPEKKSDCVVCDQEPGTVKDKSNAALLSHVAYNDVKGGSKILNEMQTRSKTKSLLQINTPFETRNKSQRQSRWNIKSFSKTTSKKNKLPLKRHQHPTNDNKNKIKTTSELNQLFNKSSHLENLISKLKTTQNKETGASSERFAMDGVEPLLDSPQPHNEQLVNNGMLKFPRLAAFDYAMKYYLNKKMSKSHTNEQNKRPNGALKEKNTSVGENKKPVQKIKLKRGEETPKAQKEPKSSNSSDVIIVESKEEAGTQKKVLQSVTIQRNSDRSSSRGRRSKAAKEKEEIAVENGEKEDSLKENRQIKEPSQNSSLNPQEKRSKINSSATKNDQNEKEHFCVDLTTPDFEIEENKQEEDAKARKQVKVLHSITIPRTSDRSSSRGRRSRTAKEKEEVVVENDEKEDSSKENRLHDTNSLKIADESGRKTRITMLKRPSLSASPNLDAINKNSEEKRSSSRSKSSTAKVDLQMPDHNENDNSYVDLNTSEVIIVENNEDIKLKTPRLRSPVKKLTIEKKIAEKNEENVEEHDGNAEVAMVQNIIADALSFSLTKNVSTNENEARMSRRRSPIKNHKLDAEVISNNNKNNKKEENAPLKRRSSRKSATKATAATSDVNVPVEEANVLQDVSNGENVDQSSSSKRRKIDNEVEISNAIQEENRDDFQKPAAPKRGRKPKADKKPTEKAKRAKKSQSDDNNCCQTADEAEPPLRRSSRARKEPENRVYEYIYVSEAFIRQYNHGFKNSKKKKNTKNTTHKKKSPTIECVRYQSQDSGNYTSSYLPQATSVAAASSSALPDGATAQNVLKNPPGGATPSISAKEGAPCRVLTQIHESAAAVPHEIPWSSAEDQNQSAESVKASEKHAGNFSWMARAPLRLKSTKNDKLLALGICLNDVECGVSTGYLCLKGQGCKPLQVLEKHHMLFAVVEGRGEVRVGEDVAEVTIYDNFLVKKGQQYLIRNLSAINNLLLYYTKLLPSKLHC